MVGVKRGREREAVKDEDLYGGSTDEAEDMETDAVGEEVRRLVLCTMQVGVGDMCMTWNYQLASNVAWKYHSINLRGSVYSMSTVHH